MLFELFLFQGKQVTYSEISTKQQSDLQCSKRRRPLFQIRPRIRALSSKQICSKTTKVLRLFCKQTDWITSNTFNLVDIPFNVQRLNISLNLFSYFDDIGNARHQMYICRHKSVCELNLLYFNEHFAWIKNLSGFIADLRNNHDRLFYCYFASDISHWQMHLSATSSSALAKILFQQFTYFLSLTASSSSQTGSI